MGRFWFLILVACCWQSAVSQAQIPAFPGAQGPGATASGGRGGDVYHVTTLDADRSGVVAGSLQHGINTAPGSGRTIVFDVGGTIYLDGLTANDRLRYGKANITIAGQTAPGPGITIAGTGTKWTGDNIILRNLTIRPNRNANGTTHDAFDLQVKNSILDHVSATWHTDEGISITDSGINSTVQYSLIGEGLNYAGHSYGAIIATEIDGTHFSYNHNYFAHNNSRLPRIGSETGSTGAVLDWSNNVVYNWQSRAGYSGTNQHSRSNFVGNYYIKGPNNGTTAFRGGDDLAGYTQIYQSTDPALANKFDDDKDNQLHDGIIFGPSTTLPNSSGQKVYAGDLTFVASPFTVTGAGPYETADVALDRVLAYGGANWASRNPIDQRIFDSASTGTGAIISDLSGGIQSSDWATVLSQRPDAQGNAPFNRPVDWDVDGDGLPGDWEREHGLDPSIANHNGDFDGDGYTDLEDYINELGAWPAPQPIVFTAAINNRYAEITNWDIPWQPSKFDEVHIPSGTVAVDAVGQHAGRLILGRDPGDHATLNITAGWIKVEDAQHGPSDGATVIGGDPAATATLNLAGGKLRTKSLTRGAGGTFNFTGGVLSADEIGFDLVNDGGVIAPGEQAGETHVWGDLSINSGGLQIEIGGQGLGEFDRLNVDGSAVLGGDLDVALIDGYTLAPHTTFELLDIGGTQSGQFAGLAEGALVGEFGRELFITYTAGDGNDVALFTLAGTAGDFNGDGHVDGNDFLYWQRNPSAGNLADWEANYGQSASATTAAVPEPGCLLLFAVATSVLLARSNR
jgi:pectate lyase